MRTIQECSVPKESWNKSISLRSHRRKKPIKPWGSQSHPKQLPQISKHSSLQALEIKHVAPIAPHQAKHGRKNLPPLLKTCNIKSITQYDRHTHVHIHRYRNLPIRHHKNAHPRMHKLKITCSNWHVEKTQQFTPKTNPPGGAPGALPGQRPPFGRRSPRSTDEALKHPTNGQHSNTRTKSTCSPTQNWPHGSQQAQAARDPCDTFMDIVLSGKMRHIRAIRQA